MDRNDDGESDDDALEAQLVAPAAVAPTSDEAIDRAFLQICTVQREAALDLLLKVGEVIVVECYGGSLDAWRARGRKDVSFRKLSAKFKAEKGSGMSATLLYRAVATYEAEQVHGVSARKHLTPSHVRAVIGLPVEKQKDLLDEAEAKGWSTGAMAEEASKFRRQNGDGRGRPPLPGFVKTLNALEKVLKNEDAFSDLETIPDLDEGEAQRRLDTVLAMRTKCDEIARALAPHAERWTGR